ncbi:hypothetical protein [Fodinicola acaciae]|uniref:hypothetical protein n=1 Tax=Fodinicola acaciae TaxID=2681555 RepID=UPI0013D09D59|nr:hypothetical protein [Fodinicola acaciae]
MFEIKGSPADFDFLPGTWTVHNRKLTAILSGGNEWDEFPSRARAWKLFEGTGSAVSIDEFQAPDRGFSGMSVRLFDPEKRQWTIDWANSRFGRFEPSPVRGGFQDGVGLFYGEDTYDGRPILVRYTWSDITDRSARWQQAFSADGGQDWETNWIMELSRA